MLKSRSATPEEHVSRMNGKPFSVLLVEQKKKGGRKKFDRKTVICEAES